MSLISRISSGFILKDSFDSEQLDTRWQASPSDEARFSLTERPGYLRMRHGYPDLYILMNSPRFDHVFEIDTDYRPLRASDQGGIALFRDLETRIELLEYYDPEKNVSRGYNRLRVVRIKDLIHGYGSDDNGLTWELIGTSYMSAPKIGMVLHGVLEDGSVPLDISEVRMYKTTDIQIGNLVEGMRVEIVNGSDALIGEGTCKPDQDYVKIDVMNQNFPITGKVKIYDTTGLLVDETEVMSNIWGGDIFWYGVKLDLEIDSIMLRQDREYQLGNMTSGVIEKKMFVANNNEIPIYNVRAAVQAFSEYYGWEWTDIATDVFGQPGTYQDSIYIGHIQPGEKVPIWLRIKRQPYQQVASLNDYKFRIMFTSG